MLGEWWARVGDRLQRDRLDRDLADELRFHEQMLARDGDASPRRRLGNTTRIREAARERWSLGVVDILGHDVRHALRGLIKSPGFSAAVIVTLALGIGANIAMLSVTDRLMFRPYPMLRNPTQVHRVYLAYQYRGQQFVASDGIAYTRYLDFRRFASSMTEFAAFRQDEMAVGSGTESLEHPVAAVSGTYFSFFAARPALGHFFGPAEDSTPRGVPVAVLGYRFWQQQYGGRNVIGQSLRAGNVLATVVGVAPRGFTGISDVAPDVIIPITSYAGSMQSGSSYYTDYHWGWLSILARRRAGVTVAQASTDLSRAYTLSWQAQRALDGNSVPPIDVTHPHAIAGPLKVGAGPDPDLRARTATWVLGVAAIVLLIACANVANLFLVRGMRRRRETALRLALGVSASRMTLLYLVEGLALALASGALGLLLAQGSASVIQRYFVDNGEPFALLTDGRTVMASIAVTLIVGLAMAIVPMFTAWNGDLGVALRSGVRGGSRGRTGLSAGLLVLQGALSVLLLVGAGLFVRSVHAVSTMRLGYDSDRVLVAFINRRGPQLGDGEAALSRRTLDAALAIPGVQAAALVNSVPFYSSTSVDLFVAGIDSVARLGEFQYEAVRGDYFGTMGTRIVRGRALRATDRATTGPVAVVSVAMARTLWPGADAIGKCFRMRADTAPCVSVVGIAEDALQSSLTGEVPLKYYVPLEQFDARSGRSLVIRTTASPETQQVVVRRALQRVMPGEYYVTTTSLAALVGQETRSWHFGATMFSIFGLLAMLVAAIGLYALVSYGVAQRSHELSVRVALGAQTGDIIGLVVGQGMRFAAGGVALGVGLALVAARWIQPLLFHEPARDPAVFVAVAVVLLAVAATAATAPALRASRADPNAALRAD